MLFLTQVYSLASAYLSPAFQSENNKIEEKIEERLEYLRYWNLFVEKFNNDPTNNIEIFPRNYKLINKQDYQNMKPDEAKIYAKKIKKNLIELLKLILCNVVVKHEADCKQHKKVNPRLYSPIENFHSTLIHKLLIAQEDPAIMKSAKNLNELTKKIVQSVEEQNEVYRRIGAIICLEKVG